MLQEDETEELDRSNHVLISRPEIQKTLSYLKSFTDCCCKMFASPYVNFDTRFPEANCREPTEEDAKNLLKHITFIGLIEQWNFILKNTRSHWFSGLFNYIGLGYITVNRLLTDRCIEQVEPDLFKPVISEINHCVGDNLRDAVHDIQMLDILFYQIPVTTMNFEVYRCYISGIPDYPRIADEIVYSSFLSTSLSLKFAQHYCDTYNIRPEIIYIKIPVGSKVCPIINQKKINDTSQTFTEFEILLDRKGTLVEMNSEQKEMIKREIGEVAYDTLSGFYIYNSRQIEEMGFYTLPEHILPYLARGKTRRKRSRRKRKSRRPIKLNKRRSDKKSF